MKSFKKILVVILAAALSMVFFSCSLKDIDPSCPVTGAPRCNCRPFTPAPIVSGNLMEGIIAMQVEGLADTVEFRNAVANFSVELFQRSFASDENSLVSPLSVLLALAMTTNGANGHTFTQMEQVLGGGIPMSRLNRYFNTLSNNLPSQTNSIMNIANAIWFNENSFVPNQDFLQTNANYFGADAFAAPFDETTLQDINNWIYNMTEGLIEDALDEIPPLAVMYLVNTIFFDARWQNVFNVAMPNRTFTAFDGSVTTRDFMFSWENIFLQSHNATGFIKPYYGGHYSFAAILPNQGVAIEDFIAGLCGKSFLGLMNSQRQTSVQVEMPSFEFEFDILLNDVLSDMGMTRAFCPKNANFSNMGQAAFGNVYIGRVIHQTNIAVNELGTRAAAATIVEGMATSAPNEMVRLDRPFVFAIICNSTNLPIFMGSVLDL